MGTLLHTFYYVAQGMVAFILAFGSGCLFLRPRGNDSALDKGLLLFLRYALGLCLISFLVVVLGLFQILWWWTLFPFVIVFSAAGWMMMFRRRELTIRDLLLSARSFWLGLCKLQKYVFLPVACSLFLLFMNIAIGSLAPDTNQDGFWYHLSLPEQWILRGNVAMFTHVMPSTYTLAADALYVPILMLSDSIAASSFYAQVTIVVLLFSTLVAFRTCEIWGALATAAIFPALFATVRAVAPIYALNDMTSALFLLSGAWLLLRPVLEERAPDLSETLAAGVLLGTAVAAKIVALIFIAPFFSIFLFIYLLKSGWQGAWRTALMVLGASFVVYLPWLVRGFIYSGNPVIHLGQNLFPLNPEFEPVLRGYNFEPRIFDFTAAGLSEALGRELRLKLYMAARLPDPLFFLTPVAALISLRSKEWALRGLAVTMLAIFLVLPILRGANELLRYFGLCYVLAIPLYGRLFSLPSKILRPSLVTILLLLFLAVAMGTYIHKQISWGRIYTIGWQYRPVLTEEDRFHWVRHVENGGLYTIFHKLHHMIPPDASVVLPDTYGVAYLFRKAHWADYSCKPLLDDWWTGMDAKEAYADLRRRGAGFILYTNPGEPHPFVKELEESGLLTSLRVDYPGVRLWQVLDE